MRIRGALAAAMAAAALQTFAAQQPVLQVPAERPFGRGAIDVRVTRPDTAEGIADVMVTLQGPAGGATKEQVGQLFSPSSSLSAAQRQQVDQIIREGFDAGGPAEAVANLAGRLQAQLLGQPPPAALPVPPTQRPPADLTLVTDTDGRVNFPSLPAGRYTIRAQHEGYYGAQTAGAAQLPQVVNGTITLKDTDEGPATLALTMMRGVVLGGRVRDPEGRPVAGVTVNALQVAFQNGRAVFNTVNNAQSDDRGVFRIFWLPPGDYYVSAVPRTRGTVVSPQDAWARTYFPGVADARGAALIAAPEGAELNGIDFAIKAEASGRISGRIINPFKNADGKPTTPSPTLYLVPRVPAALAESSNLNFQNVAPDRSNGEFEIRSILPGAYDLLASAPTGVANTANTTSTLVGGTVVSFSGQAPGAMAWGRVRVDVGKEALTDVTLVIRAGLDVKVRVTVDGAPPPYTMAPPPQRGGIDGAVVNALVARGIPTNDAIAAARAAATTTPAPIPTPRIRMGLQSKDSSPSAGTSQASFDPSGLYVFPNVPQGVYRVQMAQLPVPANYVADIRLGGVSIYDDGFLIDGPLPGDIEVFIISRGSGIQGTVENVENKPAANATIALIPAESRRQNPALFKVTRTTATGTFSFNGVGPGIYKLFAWEDVPANAWQNAEFLSRFEQMGEAVTVMGGESLNKSVKLIPKNYGR